jgi:hypothetical protein
MNQSTKTPNHWAKPEIRRLGTIKDVAGNNGTGTQQGNNKS